MRFTSSFRQAYSIKSCIYWFRIELNKPNSIKAFKWWEHCKSSPTAENQDTEEQMHIFTYYAQSSSQDIHIIVNNQIQHLQKHKRHISNRFWLFRNYFLFKDIIKSIKKLQIRGTVYKEHLAG